MCGICGIILKDHAYSNFSIGALLYKMMESQQVRAQDSAGVAIYNNDNNSQSASSSNLAYLLKVGNEYELREEKTNSGIGYSEESGQLVSQLMKDENVSIMGYTKEMKLIKNVGLVRDLDKKYNISSLKGTHGIGHLRIATSSNVDPSNAHPFSTTVMPDIAVVHNGEIANYSKLRNMLEIKGYPFYSSCDSEVIAIFLVDQLLQHGDLEKAHNEFIQKADGPFTYIASTNRTLSLVRDKFGTRKGIVGYNPGSEEYPAFWAIATDLSALDVIGATQDVKAASPGKSLVFTME
jgi:glutamine phosphoribosylpyrophosphate amidotransferase